MRGRTCTGQAATSHGSNCTLDCDESGYRVSDGEASVICYDGAWNPSRLQCVETYSDDETRAEAERVCTASPGYGLCDHPELERGYGCLNLMESNVDCGECANVCEVPTSCYDGKCS